LCLAEGSEYGVVHIGALILEIVLQRAHLDWIPLDGFRSEL